MIPAAGDFATSTLVYVALNFIPGSVYQMLRGGSIVTTFIFSITFLKMRILRQQIAGSAFALLGITIVGVSSLIFSSGSSSGSPVIKF